jgi:hypothetical protein
LTLVHTAVVENGLREKKLGTLHRHTFYLWSYQYSRWDPPLYPRCHPCHHFRGPLHPGLHGPLETRYHDVDIPIKLVRTRNVVIDGLGSIIRARHGQNGLLYRRSSVCGTLCEPKVKISQQKEPPTERMRRMYSCAVEVEVEDKTVALSMHFRTMNVREARSRSLPYGMTPNEMVCHRLKSGVQFY